MGNALVNAAAKRSHFASRLSFSTMILKTSTILLFRSDDTVQGGGPDFQEHRGRLLCYTKHTHTPQQS